MWAIVTAVLAATTTAHAAATSRLSLQGDRMDIFVPTPRFPCFRQPGAYVSDYACHIRHSDVTEGIAHHVRNWMCHFLSRSPHTSTHTHIHTYPPTLAAIAAAGADGNILLAFAENRNISSCAPATASRHVRHRTARGAVSHTATARVSVGHPDEVGSLQMRRSTDGGKTWAPLQSLYVGNIDFYAVTVAADGHTVCAGLRCVCALWVGGSVLYV